MTGFDRFKLRSEIRRGIAEAGFTEPRPIQNDTIEPALAGRDILGLAQTGTGKTAAFVLPILQRLLEKRPERKGRPRVLVVAPTRELASQIQAEANLLATFTPIGTTAIFGGVPQNRQVRELRGKPEIIVACPGRLLDLHEQGEIRLDSIEVLVLDEADHMFDMGFLPAIRRIVALVPKQRQNLLFSATMPKEIRGLADRILNKPVVVELNHSAPAETIEHALYPVPETSKIGLLERLLSGDDFTSAIVFLRTKHRAKRLAQRLDKRGHNAIALQGNMSQSQRDRAMKGFRSGQYDVLVATDIAARGIDVAGVSHVVNFDVPDTPDAYTHRIGRTGRSEMTGKACTFVTPKDGDSVRAIEKRIGAKIDRAKVEGFEMRADEGDRFDKRGGASRGGGGNRRGGGPRRGGGRGRASGSARSFKPAASTRPVRAHAVEVPRTPEAPATAFGAGIDESRPRRQAGGGKARRSTSRGPSPRGGGGGVRGGGARRRGGRRR